MVLNVTKLTLLSLISASLIGCMSNPTTKPTADKQKKIVDVNLQLGMAYLEKKDYERAKQRLLTALEYGQHSPEAMYSMAFYYQATKDNVRANEYYQRALSLAPYQGDVQNNYGAFLCATGNPREALQHFKLAVKDESYLDTASAYENAGLCAYKAHLLSDAKQYFTLALENDPKRKTATLMLAKLKGIS